MATRNANRSQNVPKPSLGPRTTAVDSAKIIPSSSSPGEVKVITEVLVRMPSTECPEAYGKWSAEPRALVDLLRDHRRGSQ